MKFIIHFYTNTLFWNPVTINNQIFLDDIDFIREQTNTNLPLEKIDYPHYKFYLEPKIEVNEETARKIDTFKHNGNYIYVAIPNKSLDKFVWKGVYTGTNIKREITKAGIKYTLDEKEIINNWIQDGAPLNWGFPVEEETEKKGIFNKIKNLFK